MFNNGWGAKYVRTHSAAHSSRQKAPYDSHGVRLCALSSRHHALLYHDDAGNLRTYRRGHPLLCSCLSELLLSDHLRAEHLDQFLCYLQSAWSSSPERSAY